MRRSKRMFADDRRGLFSGSGDKEEISRKMTFSHFLTFGSLLVAVIALFTTRVQLPILVIVGMFVYLVGAVVWASWGSLKQVTAWLRGKLNQKRIARTFYPQLHEVANEFGLLIKSDVSRGGNVMALVQLVNGWGETIPIDASKSKVLCIEVEQIYLLRDWLESIERALGSYRVDDFSCLADDLGRLIFRYHYFSSQTYNQFEMLISRGSLSEQRLRELRQEWNLCRESFTRFLEKWKSLARKINKAAGGHIYGEHVEPLKMFP